VRIAVLIALCAALASSLHTAAATPGVAELRLQPAAPVALAGVPLRLDLRVSGVQDLAGWSTELQFDAADASFQSMTFNQQFLASTGRSVVCFGPSPRYVDSGARLTTALDPGSPSMLVDDVAPFLTGEIAIIEWIDYSPVLPEAMTEGVTVQVRNPNTAVPGFPGVITVARGTQIRSDSVASSSGGGTSVSAPARTARPCAPAPLSAPSPRTRTERSPSCRRGPAVFRWPAHPIWWGPSSRRDRS
jgi:hypothetical protein